MIRIAPSLLAADCSRPSGEVRAAEAAGADRLHPDIADVLIAGTAIFGRPDYAAAIKALRGEGIAT